MWTLLVPLASSEVVDRILDVVGDRIVTQSDVEFETEFDARDASPVPALEDPAYGIEDRLVDFAVVRELAGDIEVYRPTAADVRGRLDRFRAAWPRLHDHDAFLARWGLDDERLSGFIYSRLVVERYIARNVGLPLGSTAEWAEKYPTWIASQRAKAPIRRAAR